MNLENLIVFKNLIAEGELKNVTNLISKAEKLGLSGNLPKNYLIYKLAHEKNLISETIEANGGNIGDSLKKIFVHDIENLMPIFTENFATEDFFKNYQPTSQNKAENLLELEKKLEKISDAEQIAKIFIDYYKNFGYGDLATCRAFRWDSENKNLVGIKNFEKILLEDLIGYAHQKELLTKNTQAFLTKKPANNVLLVGARGTGKSSGVKALVNEFFAQGLRLLQITKNQLQELSQIMHALKNFANKRFIIFLDDLSFDESDAEYKFLKSAIEGGVESRPENILIYATSNRRHLIRETNFEDRYDDDNLNETISLSDRFGLIIHYYAPTQTEYLEIIKKMLQKNGVELDGENLRIEGLRWEMSHSGRNGRTAKQFVNFYLGQR